MSKSKKTRQQKIIADLRRQIVSTSQHKPSEYAFSSQTKTIHAPLVTPQSVRNNTYPFFLSDLQRTVFVTSAIIGIELVLFFLLINHVIRIPMVNY